MASKYENLIIETISEVVKENNKEVPKIDGNTEVLKSTGLDSLGLANVIVRLQERTGLDPFADGFKNFQKVSELAELFQGAEQAAG